MRLCLRGGSAGETGIPIVDAGMRQLWRTGWMHNRVRMIAASVLCKNGLVPWQEGARWFWDTLVDADLAKQLDGLAVGSGLRCGCRALFPDFLACEAGQKIRSAGKVCQAMGSGTGEGAGKPYS